MPTLAAEGPAIISENQCSLCSPVLAETGARSGNRQHLQTLANTGVLALSFHASSVVPTLIPRLPWTVPFTF